MKYILMTLDQSAVCKEITDILAFHNVDYDLRIIGDPMQAEILKQKFNVETFPLFMKTSGEVIGGVAEILKLFPAPKPIVGDGPEALKIQTMREGVKLPSYGSEGAAGLDLCMHSSTFGEHDYPAYSLKPGKRNLFNTGLILGIPKGFYGEIAPRSGLAYKSGIQVMAGRIDSDYRGEVKILLYNSGDRSVEFQTGDRIAQIIFVKITQPQLYFMASDDMAYDETDRGTGGFGSTGS